VASIRLRPGLRHPRSGPFPAPRRSTAS